MSTVSQSDTERGETVTTTICVPKDLWKKIRAAALEHDTSAQQLCADGLELILKKIARGKHAA